MEQKELFITNIPSVSAIYFSLLQCKYDFYSIERDALLIDKLRSFIVSDCGEYGFFSGVKQNTCEIYPYWPRAAMLETATFYTNDSQGCFVDFNAYKDKVMSAKNLSDIERNQSFWNWIVKFPEVLKQVLQSESFRCYLKWENDWIVEQNEKHKKELRKIWDILALCMEKFKSPIQNIQVVLNPIKCVYSADYHQKDNKFIVCSGLLSEENITHEFIHHIVHSIVENHKNQILRCDFAKLKIDASYYLDNDKSGSLNAFEEYLVRMLTASIISGDIPDNLDVFVKQTVNQLM